MKCNDRFQLVRYKHERILRLCREYDQGSVDEFLEFEKVFVFATRKQISKTYKRVIMRAFNYFSIVSPKKHFTAALEHFGRTKDTHLPLHLSPTHLTRILYVIDQHAKKAPHVKFS